MEHYRLLVPPLAVHCGNTESASPLHSAIVNTSYAQTGNVIMSHASWHKKPGIVGSAAPMVMQRAPREELTKALQDSGARLLIGTDTPAPCVVPGFSVRDELEDLVDAGLTPYEALRAATANAGEFLGVNSGQIAVGQRADFILLRANPLEDVRNVSQLAGVVLNGRWLPPNELQRMLDNPARLSH